MSLTVETSVGKKFAIYLPRAIVKALNLKEGGRVLLRVSGTSLVIESVQDPLQLALSSKKFASISPEMIERLSVREQAKTIKNSA